MPTREEYWSREFDECPNCGSTEEGDSIYKCKDTFLGGVASDIGEALGADEVTHCGKVFCEGCGSSGICFRDACPTCDAPATLIGEIKTDSSSDGSDDDDSSYSSSSDDDYSYSSSSDDAGYSSSSYTPSSTPSVSKKKDEPKKDESTNSGAGFFTVIFIVIVFDLFTFYKWGFIIPFTFKDSNDVPAVHSEAPAVQAETKPEIVEPPPTVQNAPPSPVIDGVDPSFQGNDDFYDRAVMPRHDIRPSSSPFSPDGAEGVVERITSLTVLEGTGQRLPGTGVIVRFSDNTTKRFFLTADGSIEEGDRVHVWIFGNNQGKVIRLFN